MNKLIALITISTFALGAPAFAQTAKDEALKRRKEQATERAKDKAKERVDAPTDQESTAPPKVPVEVDEVATPDQESRKHLKRTARIDQIERHLTAKGIKNAGERVAKLRMLEDKRHKRALERIERKKAKGDDGEGKGKGKALGKDKENKGKALGKDKAEKARLKAEKKREKAEKKRIKKSQGRRKGGHPGPDKNRGKGKGKKGKR
jgi:hypothetical protein